MLRTISRWAWKTLLGIAALALVLAAALVLVNLRDEALDPQAAALLKPPPPRSAGAENGFPILIGLGAPAGADAREWGRAWLEEARKVRDGASAQAFFAKWKEADAGKTQLPWCNPLERACLAQAAGDRAQAEAALASRRELATRYAQVQAAPVLEETHELAAAESPLPRYQTRFLAQSLVFARAGLKAADGAPDAALEELERDAAMQRRLLASSRLLITKISTANQFARDLLVLSELLRTQRTAMAPLAARAGKVAAPLSPQEMSLKEALDAEFRLAANTMLQFAQPAGARWADANLSGIPAPLVGALYQPKATVNLLHRSRIGDAARLQQELSDWTAFVYNPVGKLLLRLQMPDLSHVSDQMRDIDGIARLVSLQAAIVAAGIDNDAVATFAARKYPTLADPHTGKPMDWDPAAGTLGFAPRSARWRSSAIGARAGRVAIAL